MNIILSIVINSTVNNALRIICLVSVRMKFTFFGIMRDDGFRPL